MESRYLLDAQFWFIVTIIRERVWFIRFRLKPKLLIKMKCSSSAKIKQISSIQSSRSKVILDPWANDLAIPAWRWDILSALILIMRWGVSIITPSGPLRHKHNIYLETPQDFQLHWTRYSPVTAYKCQTEIQTQINTEKIHWDYLQVIFCDCARLLIH